LVEPRGPGMALFTLRAAEEVRASQFGNIEDDLDAEMLGIATAIIKQRTGKFDRSTYQDRYQKALRELIEAKTNGRVSPKEVPRQTPVIDLMAALKRSLARELPVPKRATSAAKKAEKRAADRRQPALLLSVSGTRKQKAAAAADPVIGARWRERA